VQFGNAYTLVMRQVDNDKLLATLYVTVEDIQQKLIDRPWLTPL